MPNEQGRNHFIDRWYSMFWTFFLCFDTQFLNFQYQGRYCVNHSVEINQLRPYLPMLAGTIEFKFDIRHNNVRLFIHNQNIVSKKIEFALIFYRENLACMSKSKSIKKILKQLVKLATSKKKISPNEHCKIDFSTNEHLWTEHIRFSFNPHSICTSLEKSYNYWDEDNPRVYQGFGFIYFYYELNLDLQYTHLNVVIRFLISFI